MKNGLELFYKAFVSVT